MKYIVKAEDILKGFKLKWFKRPLNDALENKFSEPNLLAVVNKVQAAIKKNYMDAEHVSLYKFYFYTEPKKNSSIEVLLSNIFPEFLNNKMKYFKEVILKNFIIDSHIEVKNATESVKSYYLYTIRKNYISAAFKLEDNLMQMSLIIKNDDPKGLKFKPKDVEINIDKDDIIDTLESRKFLLEQF